MSELVIRGDKIYRGAECVGFFSEDDKFSVSLLIDLLDKESGTGRYIWDEFPTRALAEEWMHDNADKVHVFTRRPSRVSLNELMAAVDDIRAEEEK